MLFTGVSAIHIRKCFIVLACTFRHWVRKVLELTENISRKSGWLTNGAAQVSTFLDREHVLPLAAAVLEKALQGGAIFDS